MRTILLLLFLAVLVYSEPQQQQIYRWIYQGNYVLGEVLGDLCSRSGCVLGLSGEVVNLPVTLSVKTSKPVELLNALRSSLQASGYYLQGNLTGTLSVVRDLTSDLAVYVDCQNNVQTVPKLHLKAYQKSDSLKCAQQNAPEIQTVSQRWRIEFYSVSHAALEQYGLQLEHPLVYGSFDVTDFLKKQHLSNSWNLDYVAKHDSLFETRTVSFELDSTVNFSWGTQKQVIDKTYMQEGVQITSYDWRKYGIDINIKSYPKMLFNYTIRSPDESTISGSSSLGQDSTIFVVASYDLNQEGRACFLPFLPIFCKPTYTNEKRYFVLRLYPLPEISQQAMATEPVKSPFLYHLGGSNKSKRRSPPPYFLAGGG